MGNNCAQKSGPCIGSEEVFNLENPASSCEPDFVDLNQLPCVPVKSGPSVVQASPALPRLGLLGRLDACSVKQQKGMFSARTSGSDKHVVSGKHLALKKQPATALVLPKISEEDFSTAEESTPSEDRIRRSGPDLSQPVISELPADLAPSQELPRLGLLGRLDAKHSVKQEKGMFYAPAPGSDKHTVSGKHMPHKKLVLPKSKDEDTSAAEESTPTEVRVHRFGPSFGPSVASRCDFLEMVCDTIHGEGRRLLLKRRPLGVTFTQQGSGALIVSAVFPNSYAAELGMRPGWSVKTVGREDVRTKTCEEAQRAIQTGMMSLPEYVPDITA